MTHAIKPEPREIPVGLIDEPELAARLGMDPVKLDELTASIRKHGIIQRLILARNGDRYEVVAGHRRFLCGKRAGLAAVPADVYPNKAAALEGLKHAENRFREDLSPAEEASYFDDLLKRDAGGDVEKLCEIVGESFDYVSTRLLLFQGCPLVFTALAEKKIKLGIAIELNKVTDERVRRALLHDAMAGGATIAVVRGWVTSWKLDVERGSEPLPPPDAPSPAGAAPTYNFFTCVCCGGTENVHLMVQVNVHQHCKLAILDKLLAAYNNPG